MPAIPTKPLTLQLFSDGQTIGTLNLSVREHRRMVLIAAANETNLPGLIRMAFAANFASGELPTVADVSTIIPEIIANEDRSEADGMAVAAYRNRN